MPALAATIPRSLIRGPAAKGRFLGRLPLCALLALIPLTLSCTANRMYRAVSVEQHPGYSLAFIEFDDQGELWSPSQLDRALAHLERLNQSASGVALVLFVHGWNTDASPREEEPETGALYRFRAMLVRLDESIRRGYPELDIPVLGVYLGWRGRASRVPLLREASFYGRRGAAERIAGASATEVIYRVLITLRENPASRSVLVGHSFGSMILERALAQAVVAALLAAPGEELIFPADLVVLLNPAGSASQTRQLVDILARNRVKTYRSDERGHRFERPLLVSFTSEADTATRVFFPAGMRFKAMSKRFRDYGQEHCSPIPDQRHLYTHTAGHLSALHSHEVSVSPKRDRSPEASPPDRLIPAFLGYEESYDLVTQQIGFSFDGETERFTIRRKPRALNDTPYWIMQVPRELIPNHSAVLTEDTFRLVEAVLALSRTYDASVDTYVEREDGVRPVAIVPRPNGTALFLDRGRGVYAVRRDATRPVFLSCLSEAIEPGDAIGFQVAGHLVYAVLTTHSGGDADRRCQTELYEFQVEDEGYRRLSRLRFAGSGCYSAAALDLRERRTFLSLDGSGGPRLLVADLTEELPRPRPLVDLPGSRAPTLLYFEDSLRRLFTAQRDSGQVGAIDIDADPPELRRIAGDLGWPLALGYDRIRKRLYVADARSRALWALECGDRCGEPTPFLHSEGLGHPTTLAVALDGAIWLGDLQDQTLTVIAPDGRVESTLRTLSGTPAAR